MDQITARTLRSVEWKPVYSYPTVPARGCYLSFVTYACDQLPGLTITKETRGNRRVKTITIYKFNGRRTDSPTQIVKYWNEYVKASKGDHSKPGQPSGRDAADRVKPAGRTPRETGV